MTRLLTAALVLTAAMSTAGPLSPGQPGPMTWDPDTLLPDFWAHTIDLGHDYDGPIRATLIRRPLHRERDCAVLYIHGYVDYFFQAHLADYYQNAPAPATTRTGCDFFALDLRKYGRSLPAGYKYPNFAKSLDEYFQEITEALALLEYEGYPFVLLNGHSTGALTAVRYLQDGPRRQAVSAVFLNSPFLDFNDRDLRWFGVGITKVIGWVAPHAEGKSTVPLWYARALLRQSDACADCHGRWEFKTTLKPIEGFKVFFGWLRAIANAQERARKGGIAQPILIMHSARSNDGAGDVWHEEFRRSDLVLDVEDMKRDGPKLGPHVTIQPIEGGVHDLSLSDPDAQTRVFNAVSAWLQTLR
ncbi:MAG: alpha/beta fold hydrolase [Actinomycetota bacterium]|nr:alpha/beta fold hydrolase [Actinomycetota bacterium]